ncbi:nucleoside 2-deoxyribosyltransferase domain-containing protein [Profundibacter sp.]
MKVFLGGTCNKSTWRDDLIHTLEVDYFNPVVDDWTPDCQAEEIRQRETCDFCLYVITPKMTGVYSIAEVVDDSNKRPRKTLFCIIQEDGSDRFSDAQMRSLSQVGKMVEENGAIWLRSLNAVAAYLNE